MSSELKVDTLLEKTTDNGLSVDNHKFIDNILIQSNDFYESHEYRKKWDYEYTPDSIHAKYDHEQNERIIRIGIENIRGKSVLDLGASAGVFLDAISSSAATTIAIEPALIYKEYQDRMLKY